MSFSLTTEQIVDESKDVTRRLGWWFLDPRGGEKVQACEKCQGIKKGQTIKRLKVIETVRTSKERLCHITAREVEREGFPDMSPQEFVTMFCKFNKCSSDIVVNRIEFRYV